MEDLNGDRKGTFRPVANRNHAAEEWAAHHDHHHHHHHQMDDSKSTSSQKSEQEYHPTEGSLGDGTNGNMSSMNDHHPFSCARSVGSVGSQGSGDRHYNNNAASQRNHHSFHHRQFPAGYLMNGETRFPTASYAASEAGKSDVATVCSGSVIEDIEVSSVMSGGDNSQSWGVASNAHPSPPSSVKVAPAAVASSGTTRRAIQGRGVEFAASLQQELMLSSVVPQNNLQPSVPIRWHALEHEALLASNNMGPPLSRALLLQHRQFGSFSRAESVKSFGSNAGSDVIAHVDTDDCGGSLIESVTDGHSVHSQEDNRGNLDDESGAATSAAAMPLQNLKDDGEEQPQAHPWLLNGDGNASGRVSPGGTIYRGRGVRRYQGRYMHLPLKRFHQDAMAMNTSDDQLPINHEYEGNFETAAHWNEDEKLRSRSESPPDRRNYPARKRSWSRSRSRSRSRSPNRSRSRSPKSSRSERQDVSHRKASKNGDSAPRYRGHRKSGDRSYSRSGSKSNREEQGSSRSPVRYKHRRK